MDSKRIALENYKEMIRKKKKLDWAKPELIRISDIVELPGNGNVDEDFCEEIRSNFDPKLFIPILIAKLPNGKYVVYDGHHRLTVATAEEMEWVWAFVRKVNNVAEAHALYKKYNKAQRPKDKYQYHINDLHAGEKRAVEIQDTVDKYHFHLEKRRSAVIKDRIQAVGELEDIYDDRGIEMIDLLLEINREAFNGRAGSLSSTYFSSMSSYLSSVKLETFDKAGFIQRLKAIKVTTLLKTVETCPQKSEDRGRDWTKKTWCRYVYTQVMDGNAEQLWAEIAAEMNDNLYETYWEE